MDESDEIIFDDDTESPHHSFFRQYQGPFNWERILDPPSTVTGLIRELAVAVLYFCFGYVTARAIMRTTQ